MILKEKSLLIFDLDGTLIDSVPDLAAAVNHMLGVLGRNPFDEETIRYWVGNGAQTLVKRALSGSVEVREDLDDNELQEALDIFLDYYAQHCVEATRLYDGVAATLEQLRQRGFRMAIVTNKPEAFVTPILQGLGVAYYFERFLGGDSLAVKKPDPAPLLHICAALNVKPEHAVMIGDSKNDILAAQHAQMQSIGVSYGYNYGVPISDFKPTLSVDGFAAIATVLER